MRSRSLPTIPCSKLLLAACLLLSGCTHDLQLMKTEDELSRYGATIRWGQWEAASEFQPPAKQGRLDFAFLKNVHVTSYDRVHLQEHKGSDVLRQTVEIRYYIEPAGVEQRLTDRQTWRFDNEKDRWFLQSGLPDFK